MTEITTNLSSTGDNTPQQQSTAPTATNQDTVLEQQIYQITTDCVDFMKYAHHEINKAQEDKQITEWFEVNFQQHSATLAARKVPTTTEDTKSHLLKEIPSLLNSLQQLKNDFDNLNAELKLEPMPQLMTLLPRARRLEAEQLEISQRLNIALANCNKLKESYTILYEDLNLQNLLPFAQNKALEKTSIFNTGYKLYQLASDHHQDKVEMKNLDDYFEEASKQETLLTNINLESIPKLAATVIKEHIKTTVTAAATVKEGIELLREAFAIEYEHIKETEARIPRLNKSDITELLTKIDLEAEALCKGMLHFQCKSHYLNNIDIIEEILQLLQFLQRSIKKDLQTQLKEEVSSPTSLLNPETAATIAAEKFLSGPAGLWRGFKLLVRLIIKKKPAVNLVVFENSLREALNSCDTFFGDSTEIIPSLEKFIQKKLSVYDAPFPYDDLHQIMKDCLHDYRSRVENFCHSYKIDVSSLTGKNETSTIHKIINQIDMNSKKLIKE